MTWDPAGGPKGSESSEEGRIIQQMSGPRMCSKRSPGHGMHAFIHSALWPTFYSIFINPMLGTGGTLIYLPWTSSGKELNFTHQQCYGYWDRVDVQGGEHAGLAAASLCVALWGHIREWYLSWTDTAHKHEAWQAEASLCILGKESQSSGCLSTQPWCWRNQWAMEVPRHPSVRCNCTLVHSTPVAVGKRHTQPRFRLWCCVNFSDPLDLSKSHFMYVQDRNIHMHLPWLLWVVVQWDTACSGALGPGRLYTDEILLLNRDLSID